MTFVLRHFIIGELAHVYVLSFEGPLSGMP